jgi:arylsulfatase A-like enzyme
MRNNRGRVFVVLTLLVGNWAFLTSTASASEQQENRPNILLIYTDDQSHRTVGSYPEAYDWVETPNIDQLADQGIQFANFFPGAWCMASRATLLTGKHSFGVSSMRMEGIYPGSQYDPDILPFWPKTFREEGYFMAHIGKWHTGTDTGYGRDWDHQIVWNRPRYPENALSYYYDQLIEFNGGKPEMVPGYSTDNYTKWADEFIRSEDREAGEPWFLWLAYSAPHREFTPAQRHLDQYANISVANPEDIFPPREGKPTYVQDVDNWTRGKNGEANYAFGVDPDQPPDVEGSDSQPEPPKGYTGELDISARLSLLERGVHGNSLSDWVRQYHQTVSSIDESVGKLVSALEETDQRRNTLIIFTSDQGIAFGQHGFRTKFAPYDANIRAPLIFSMPGTLAEGVVNDSPIGGVDLVPTFFSFAGIDLPWEMHGHDMYSLLNAPELTWPYSTLQVLTGTSYGADTDIVPADPKKRDMAGIPWWVSLHDGRYKYIRTLVAGEPEELYDLKTDPEELKNLAGDGEHRKLLAEMRNATITELQRTEAKFVENLPPTSTEN